MNYRINPKNGDNLSILGFGCMRFPTRNNAIDEIRTESLIVTAIEQGVNYFDTAYVYQFGKSERILGRVLAKGYRDRVKIATKLPHFMVNKEADLDAIFNKQLQRLQTDRIDYYLIHMLPDTGTWERLQGIGIEKWIAARKACGQIINIGFSFHGIKDQFIKLVDSYAWDFCQIQYNFLDENNQAGTAGLEYAAACGLPIIVMEPLRGGRIVTGLPKEAEQIWECAKPARSAAEWALRWVWNHPEVTVVLSGMSNEEQVAENIRTASEAAAGSLRPDDLQLFERVKAVLNKNMKVDCTGCSYCLPCPAGVDIAACFSLYNEKYALKSKRTRLNYLQNTGAMTAHPAYASLCIKCGKCEARCPQAIPIRAKLDEVKSVMEGRLFKVVVALGKKVMKVKSQKP